MGRHLAAALFVVLVQASSIKSWANQEEDDLVKDCMTNTSCGDVDVRFPFRLQSSPQYCGVAGLEVSCPRGGEAMITVPNLGSCKLTSIDYTDAVVTVELGQTWTRCPLQNLTSFNFSSPGFGEVYFENEFTLVRCAGAIKTDPDWITGPILCPGIYDQFVYAASSSESMDNLPHGCSPIGESGSVPSYYRERQSFEEVVQSFIQEPHMSITVREIDPCIDRCIKCEEAGKHCGFNRMRSIFCIDHQRRGPSIRSIIGSSIGACLALVLGALILLYLLRKSNKDQRTRLKVEMFLATYGDAKPTRYTFADVKRITKRFKNKLGQGGYGSVYKGELPNGVPVAVKMLERSKGEGEEFINEVATIGRIHHANIVRLLGFCSERSTRALIYEFMSNESLEKYIFSREDNPLSMDKLLNIAIGVALGIEYLHQGCQHRILHFDIKPHNVLLDHNFNPKISDFGLAKLCSREQSIVTMTAARGTMGYIAPEMYSRNFGTVSYKSDVYSFGMLVLEMVGGRKNLDPEIGKESEIYFPEWVYDRLVNMQHLREVEVEDQQIANKLAVIALWCIQWNPSDRPSMTRVLQMLIGNQESLSMPPKPFVSPLDQEAT